MTELPVCEFDRSWLRRVTTPDEQFGHDPRPQFIESDDGSAPEMVEEFRAQLAEERAAVAAVLGTGDELWEWRNETFGPKFEAGDAVGECGIAIVRAGRVITAWVTGVWA